MMNLYKATGYAVNKNGLTVGISYQVEAEDVTTARNAALGQAMNNGMTYPRILRVVLTPVSEFIAEVPSYA